MVPESTTLKTTNSSMESSPKSPMKMIVFALLGVLILVMGYKFIFKKDKMNINEDYEMTEDEIGGSMNDLGYDPENGVTVTLSENFSPQETTIKVGQSVTWTNQSGQKATVNSSPHPEHTDTPLMNLGEFDDGDSLTLVFIEAGTYKYHNHLDSTQFGTVTVEE